eukprot:TRINITY_DN6854_c0_g2_i3.p1 TRINITY_DN6854_c0_g2~~TRINITY_DN6854_c0_g2_i3.p1  ORF type:complete len:386 (+),score=44.75 TRINITY_DN6854_c0_g2_i3:43-1200(+)
MHLATANGIVAAHKAHARPTHVQLCVAIAKAYKECWKQMHGRAPGKTTGKMLKVMNVDGSNYNKIPFNMRACGCGAAMRAACIGLRYSQAEQLSQLIAVSVDAGRMTHHHPTGYLGSVVAALFVSYGIQQIPPRMWGAKFMATIPLIQDYIRSSGRSVEQNLSEMSFFIESWRSYLKKRRLTSGETEAMFPANYDQVTRERFYLQLSYRGWPGASGHDSVLIAYDALLSAIHACKPAHEQAEAEVVGAPVEEEELGGGAAGEHDDIELEQGDQAEVCPDNEVEANPVPEPSSSHQVQEEKVHEEKALEERAHEEKEDDYRVWNELVLRGVLHGGDNDSTGTIAAAFYASVFGFRHVPKSNYQHVEFVQSLYKLGDKIYQLSQSGL